MNFIHTDEQKQEARATLTRGLNNAATNGAADGDAYPNRRTSGTGLDKTRPNLDAEKTLSGKDKVSGTVREQRPSEDRVRDFSMPNPDETIYKMLTETDDHGQYKSDHRGNTYAARMSVQEQVQRLAARGLVIANGSKPSGDALTDGDDHEDPAYVHCKNASEAAFQAALAEGNERRGHLIKALGHVVRACRAHEKMCKKA